MKKIFLVFSFIVLFFLIKTQPVAARVDSSVISHDITYSVLESGVTHVVMNTAITNESGQTYTASYTIDLGFDDIKNVKASDGGGNIDPIISSSENGKSVKLDFNQKIVGAGNILNFKLTFDTERVAKKTGNIWEVNIPGLARQNDFSYFNVHVKTPASFGAPSFIKPALKTSDLNFTKEELGNSGISISFGKYQIYGFDLYYHIKNANLFPVKTEIALPPSTNYQDVFIGSIDPKPLNVFRDADGNWLAQYYLMPSEKKEINVKGKARISLYPKEEELRADQFAAYLKEKPYWQTLSPKIQQLAKELKTPKAIYDYVVKTLNYDVNRLKLNNPRAGAEAVLNNPSSAVCLEFTDLFIAIARSAGIPAREVDGFANAENSKQRPVSLIKDVLHAWPEYYDKEQKTWIMIDPTWGNTTQGVDYFNTLDFDHFAFVIKGMDSEYPVPAGGYKLPGNEVFKDVNVDFAPGFSEELPAVDIKIDVPGKIFSGLTVNGFIMLQNKTGVVFPDQVLTIKSDFLTPAGRKIMPGQIPPFGYLKLPLYFEKMPILTNKKAIIELKISDKSVYKVVEISPLFIADLRIVGGVIGAILAIAIFIGFSRARSLFIFRQKQ